MTHPLASLSEVLMTRSLWPWVAAIAVLCGGVAVPQAKAAFSFNGFSGAPAPGTIVDFKLQLFEVALKPGTPALTGVPATDAPVVKANLDPTGALAVGGQIYGIFNITSIQSTDGSKQFWVQTATQQLSGEFFNYNVSSVTAAGTASEIANFSGGNIKMLFNSSVTFTAATGPFTPGWTDIATSNGVVGSDFLDSTGIGGVLPEPNILTSLQSTFSTFDSAGHFTGVGDGFVTVTFSATINFKTDAFDSSTAGAAFPYPGSQDGALKSNFDNQPAGFGPPGSSTSFQNTQGWTVAGQDPLRFQLAGVVPEPASLTLIGIGGLCSGLVALRRKLRQKSAA
jgi:hypothetical protein